MLCYLSDSNNKSKTRTMKPYHTLQPWRNHHPHPGFNQAPLYINPRKWKDDRDMSLQEKYRLYDCMTEIEYQHWKTRMLRNKQIQRDSHHVTLQHFDREIIQRFLFFREHAPRSSTTLRMMTQELKRMYV
jgi:hypothetical protein